MALVWEDLLGVLAFAKGLTVGAARTFYGSFCPCISDGMGVFFLYFYHRFITGESCDIVNTDIQCVRC